MRYYLTEDGAFPSVTSVISATADTTALDKWKSKVGEKEANRISGVARRRGTAIHTLLEKHIKKEEIDFRKEMPSNLLIFEQMKRQVELNMSICHGLEVPLYSKTLRVAGRCDCIATWNDRLSIVDYKTSKAEKEEKWIQSYFIQACFYSIMLEEMLGHKAKQLVILIGCDSTPDAQVFVKDRGDYIEDVRRIVKEFRMKSLS